MVKSLQAVYVDCDADYKRRIKVAAAERGMTVARFIKEALDAYFVASYDRPVKQSVRKSSAPIRYKNVRE